MLSNSPSKANAYLPGKLQPQTSEGDVENLGDKMEGVGGYPRKQRSERGLGNRSWERKPGAFKHHRANAVENLALPK